MKRIFVLLCSLAIANPASSQVPGLSYYPLLSSGFNGGNVSGNDVYSIAQAMAQGVATTPTAGGTITINSASLGSYDYRIAEGNQTVSSFTNSDWFTTTADSRSAWVIIKGDLTINSGQTFIPSNRKLFTVVYVTGACSISGSISMSARGANHSAGGGNVTAAAIRIATGTFSSVTNPEVPATGASGGAALTTDSIGNTGGAGSAGQTGGGGSGSQDGVGGTSGAGAVGTSFGGGPGGGGNRLLGTATAGTANGAAGGAANSGAVTRSTGGGAGNPGGAAFTGATGTSAAGGDGTGGVLIVICAGALSSNGTIVANGVSGGVASISAAGGSSGGGSVTVLSGSDTSSITPTAAGGAAAVGDGGGHNGGAGGAGTARKLIL